MNSLFYCAIFALLVSASHAQLNVNMRMERDSYLLNEPVFAVISVTNRSGRKVLLHSKAEGRIARSWLDFSLRESGGNPLHRHNHGVFRAAELPAGQTISRRVNLSKLYGIGRQGNFSSHARVQIDGQVYTSNNTQFDVSEGSTYFTQPFGAPGTKYPNREYRVITFNDGKKTSIYAAVHDSKTKRPLSTGRLSNALLFQKPQATLDGKNNLHVLYLSTPEIFVHCVVNKDGALTASNFLKRAASGVPSLMAFASGEIKVRGGIPFDPKKEAAERNRARRVSERATR